MPVEEIAQYTLPSVFDKLKVYSRADVELLNWYHCAFFCNSDWQLWIKEALVGLVETRVGTRLRIFQSTEVDPAQNRTYVFEKSEVLIGRNSDSDVALPVNAVSRRHARIFALGTDYYIEDLASGSGTVLGDQRLNPSQPQLLSDGNAITILPYSFKVAIEEIWAADEHAEVRLTSPISTTWTNFQLSIPPGFCTFSVEIHPGAGEALLAVNRRFLETVAFRTARGIVSELASSDAGIFDFLLLSLLERANRELAFPFQFALMPRETPAVNSGPGVGLELSVGIEGATGAFKVFLPRTSLAAMRSASTAIPPLSPERPIAWALTVCAGYTELAVSDLADLRNGDILLFVAAIEVLLPRMPHNSNLESGWQGIEAGHEPYRIKISRFFERSSFMEQTTDLAKNAEPESSAAVRKPDLNGLPVKLQVVLGQVELTLRDLDGLAEGSILELDRGKGDPVQLIANGKLLGVAELIEVEGKLGAQITRWSIG
jgi:type III secretion system YscQ/HrcQ family protein